MICFQHNQKQAIGLCKSCGKGVCSECSIEFPKGLACSEACATDGQELVEMNERGKKIYGIGPHKSDKLASGVWVWLLLTSAMWLAFAISYFNRHYIDYGTLAIAVMFTIISVIIYRSSKRTGLNC